MTPGGRLLRLSCRTPKLLPFDAHKLPADSDLPAPPQVHELFLSAAFALGDAATAAAMSLAE